MNNKLTICVSFNRDVLEKIDEQVLKNRHKKGSDPKDRSAFIVEACKYYLKVRTPGVSFFWK